MSQIVESITKHLTALALNELALLKQEGTPDEDIRAIVLQNNDTRIEGVVAGLEAYIADLERQAGVTS